MNKQVISFLKSYSYETDKIDRLLVSAFIYSNGIDNIKNALIRKVLIKESEPEFVKLNEFLSLDKFESIESLIEAFEFVISPKDKIVTGAVYTPKSIRDFIVKSVFRSNKNQVELKICDPACGCGGFLYTAAKKIRDERKTSYKEIFAENIFGLDIQEYSTKRSELLLTLLAISDGEDESIFQFNLYNGNALSFDWSEVTSTFQGFSHIIGNPPYVCSRNIDDSSKVLLSNWSVCASGHPDLYIPFFEIGMKLLKENGILGYITMNTFFKSVNGRALRAYFAASKFDFSIIDFGGNQVFNTKSTYTCICLIENTKSEQLCYTKVEDAADLARQNIEYDFINYAELNPFEGWNLQNNKIIEKIESTGTALGKQFKTRNGIATLKNNIYIFTPSASDESFYYLENGDTYPIEKEICKDILNPNKLIKTSNIKSLKQKIIFPYYYEENEVKIYSERVLRQNFPHAHAYLLTQKEELAKRDKGKGKYEKWYAFGRNQSLEKLKNKLLFPHISPVTPHFVINSDENLLFYNGIAIVSDGTAKLKMLQKLLGSRLFWYYVTNTSKPYGSGYFSLSRNYIKNFGVYNFSKEDITYMLSEENLDELNLFIENKYQVDLAVL